MINRVCQLLHISERRACRVLGQTRSMQRRMIELASRYGRYGYRPITALLRREGFGVNHKRVERI